MWLKSAVAMSTLAVVLVFLQETYPTTYKEITKYIAPIMFLPTYLTSGMLRWAAERNARRERVFAAEELRAYTGNSGSKGLYLALLGHVFDVSAGAKHYGPGGTYHAFAGRDASRAFITGDFTEKGLSDHVNDLTLSDIRSLKKWLDFYFTDYNYEGRLIGRYFDEFGEPTKYMLAFRELLEEAIKQDKDDIVVKKETPPCNSEWTQDTGTKVWCTKSSGGIERDWVGVPRRLYEPGSDTYRCACIKFDQVKQRKNVEVYPGCNPKATSCSVRDE